MRVSKPLPKCVYNSGAILQPSQELVPPFHSEFGKIELLPATEEILDATLEAVEFVVRESPNDWQVPIRFVEAIGNYVHGN